MSHHLLQDDRHFSPQKHACTADNFRVKRRQQLGTSCRYVASENQKLRIKDVQKAYQCCGKRLESQIEDTTCAWIAIGCCFKYGFGGGGLSAISNTQKGRRGPVEMGKVVGFDRARGETGFKTSVIATYAEPAADIHGHVTEMACCARGS